MTDAAGPGLDLPAGLPESRLRRRALALGLLAAVLAALAFGVVAPVAEAIADRAETEDRQRALLARLQRVEAEAPALRRQIETLDAELAGAETVLRAPTPSQAVAQLQAAAARLLEAESIRLESTQPLPPIAQGRLLRIGVRLEFRAGIEPLHRLFRAIEAHQPALTVRDALIAAPGRTATAGGPLSVRLELSAVARVEATGG